MGSWGDDDALDEGDNVGGGEVEVNIDVMYQQLSADFEVRLCAWRNHFANVNWSKVDSNISIRDPLALDMIELMGMHISALHKGLSDSSSNFGHLLGMSS